MPKNSKSNASPVFTVQVRLVLVADVEVEALTLEEAIETGKTWHRKDIVTLDSAASECDSKTEVVGAWSQRAWGTD